MTRLNLLLNFVGRFTAYGALYGLTVGFIGGGLLGALSLSLLAALYFALLFGAAGVVSGLLIGGVNGIVLSVVTITLDHHEVDFKRLTLITSIIVTFIGGLFWFSSILSIYSETGQINIWVALLPITLATAIAAYASQRIARWYTRAVSEQI